MKSTLKVYNTDNWKIISASYFFSSLSMITPTNRENLIAFKS